MKGIYLKVLAPRNRSVYLLFHPWAAVRVQPGFIGKLLAFTSMPLWWTAKAAMCLLTLAGFALALVTPFALGFIGLLIPFIFTAILEDTGHKLPEMLLMVVGLFALFPGAVMFHWGCILTTPILNFSVRCVGNNSNPVAPFRWRDVVEEIKASKFESSDSSAFNSGYAAGMASEVRVY